MNNLEEQNAIFILPKSEEGLQSSACSAVISGIWHRFRGTGGGGVPPQDIGRQTV